MVNWRERLEKLRRWVDDENLPEIGSLKIERFDSEIFLQKVLQKIDEVLQHEIVRSPIGETYIPSGFTVFIGSDDYNTLPENKRDFFEKVLCQLMLKKAQERAGKSRLTVDKLTIRVKVNALLDNGEIDVKTLSDSSSQTIETDVAQDLVNKSKGKETTDDIGTIDDEGDLGILYRVEIWQGTKKIGEFPIVQKTIVVGREDDDKSANLRLPTENTKISRLHAEIHYGNDGIFVNALHKNPTIVSGKVIRKPESTKLEENGEIQIYDFLLKIKFLK